MKQFIDLHSRSELALHLRIFKRRFIPFLCYAVLILVVFWGVLWPTDGKILFGPDITRYHYWQRQFLGAALQERSVPWWNPYILMGVPYLEHPQIPVWYPPNLLFVFVPANIAISWYIALHLLLAMTAMYVLARTLAMDRLIAWGTGIAYGLSAYFVARIPAGHIDIIAASAWMPLVIAAFAANIKNEKSKIKNTDQKSKRTGWETLASLFGLDDQHGRRSLVIAGVVLAIQLLSGHPMVAVYTLEAVLIVTLLLCLPRFTAPRAVIEQISKAKSFMPLARMTLAIFLGLALSAIQILPNAQYVARSIRTFPFPDAWAQLGTPTIKHLLELIDPFYFYNQLPDSGFGYEHVGYIGKAPLFFAIVAVASWLVAQKKKRGEILMFFLIAVFELWMWLGSNAPIDLFSWVRSWFPLYSQIRIPARHIILFVLSASVLFGFGLNLVTSKLVHVIVVGLLLVDLVPFARHHLSLVPVPEQAEDTELVSLLTSDKSLYRFLPNFYHGNPLRDILEFNAPIGHKIQSVSGYDTPPLRNMYEFLLAVNGYQFSDVLAYSESIPLFRVITSPYLNVLNVKYVLVPISGDTIKEIQAEQFVLVKENVNRGWRLYENKNVFPRFFIASNIQKEPNRKALLATIGKGSVDPKTTIIVDASTVDTSGFSPDCPEGSPGNVSVESYGYGTIRLAAATPCNAFLATSEIMYPGWTAIVDGKSTPVFEGNAAFRTLYLPRGTHRIEFSYRPAIVVIGAVVSIATILLACYYDSHARVPRA